ncbi:MAG TPA: alpha/beta hydrolase [Aquabacterium sp.]|nr:alpha/beta hydrolase [Aquabacterium sp.]
MLRALVKHIACASLTTVLLFAEGAAHAASAAGEMTDAPPYSVRHWRVDQGVEVDVFTPAGKPPPNGWSAVLVIPGGGWSTVDVTHAKPIATALAERGLLAVTTTYRTAPASPWPAQLQDVIKVVWQMRSHAQDLQLNPEHVAALGASAGALMAGHLGTHNQNGLRTKGESPISSQVQRVISIGGPWDLAQALRSFAQHQNQAHADYPDVSALGMISNLFGGRLPSDMEAQLASPQHWISTKSAPTLFLHGADDTLVPPAQSRSACQAMLARQVPCRVVIFPGVGHTVAPEFLDPILTFLSDWLPSAPTVSPRPSSEAIEVRHPHPPIQ